MELGNTKLTDRIIAAAIRIHKELGPGFLEIMYEEALSIELAAAGLAFERQKLLPIFYREHLIGEHRLDLLVEGEVIVEFKGLFSDRGYSFRYCPFLPEGLEFCRRFVAELCECSPHHKARRTRVSSKPRE